MNEYWLISYCTRRDGNRVAERPWRGTIGEWRIAMRKHDPDDGPYILLNASPISEDEFNALYGNIG